MKPVNFSTKSNEIDYNWGECQKSNGLCTYHLNPGGNILYLIRLEITPWMLKLHEAIVIIWFMELQVEKKSGKI